MRTRLQRLSSPRLKRTSLALPRLPLGREMLGSAMRGALVRRHFEVASLFLGLLGLPIRSAWAQEPAASCSCNAKTGAVVVRYTPDLTQTKPPWPTQPPPVHFMSLLDLDKAQTTVEGTRSKTFSCQLKSDRFEIKLEPGVPNPNLLGRCGADVTGVVTIKRNDVVVLNEQEFEDLNCHARERMLERITLRDGSSKPELNYAGYGDK